ncbi:hypothetical protein CYMTET_37178 [Cymbomonas tetramitiformis]|uniref:Small ubiquitin-related modifier n=1 Tax=Cymbomonas tetramitiformis TaxID=36881 RepID=A0AAE0CEH3_9CHLO|nr:hypothetical protein CYMTET_37178 [Cymbomonas tetramitiformis]
MGENKPETKQEQKGGETINIKVKDQDSNEVHFRVKTTTKFDKIMSAFCEKRGIDKQLTRFIFDGHRLRPDQTPQEVDMEEGDSIDMMLEQVGGSFKL